MIRALKKWWFSLLLGAAYLGIFHFWKASSYSAAVISGTAVSIALFAVLLAIRRTYFLNVWEALFHSVVILDILLEAVLVKSHETRGYYLCALAFAVVIAGYRYYLWRRGASERNHPNPV